jgi:hypothetical protein
MSSIPVGYCENALFPREITRETEYRDENKHKIEDRICP